MSNYYLLKAEQGPTLVLFFKSCIRLPTAFLLLVVKRLLSLAPNLTLNILTSIIVNKTKKLLKPFTLYVPLRLTYTLSKKEILFAQ